MSHGLFNVFIINRNKGFLSFLKSNETKREENQKSTQIKYRSFTFVAESADLRCL